jgi:RepB DNA-primase from phage plasmid
MHLRSFSPHSSSLRAARASALRQLAAMGCARFDLGVLRAHGMMLLHESLTAPQIRARFAWLSWENTRRAHIFVRPHGLSRLTLVDDLSSSALNAMKRAGFAPTLVVETSPRNFQAWLKHARVFSNRESSTVAARELAARFGGDQSSADWRHFGRLAGFINQKPNRRLPNGLQPVVLLRESSAAMFAEACRFQVQVHQMVEQVQLQRLARRLCSSSDRHPKRTVADFHQHPRYRGDLHRADMAWASYAARHGASATEITAGICGARDLSKKGGIRRQFAYAERTAAKAISNLAEATMTGAASVCAPSALISCERL